MRCALGRPRATIEDMGSWERISTPLGLLVAVTSLVAISVAGARRLPADEGGYVSSAWQLLEPGLEFAAFRSPQPARIGDSQIRILRIDPAQFELRLLNASAVPDGKPLTAKQWVQRHGLVAATNASLYQADYRTSVSLMKTRTHTNNPRLSRDNAILAFDRLDPALPPVQIIDRTCQDFATLQGQYGTLVQSIRMISCRQRNVWSQQAKKWSTAAIGIDHEGRVLLIHVRSPYSTHDLINILLALPINLAGAMYVEGGPEAQLSIRAGGRELDLIGTHGSSGVSTGNMYAPPLPNAIGVRRINRDSNE